MPLTKDHCQILVVDDAPENFQVLEAVLSRENYGIITAENGLEALKKCAEQPPDLILLDINMPELNGFEACERLKKNPDTADIPVVFLTSKTASEDIVKGFELGAVDYIIKPYNPTELLVRVHTHLHTYRLQQALKDHIEENERLKREQDKFVRHELKNILTPIQGYADILRSVDLGPKEKKWAESIYNNTLKIIDLLDDLRNLQEIESGIVTPDKAPHNITALLQQIRAEVDAQFTPKATVVFQDVPDTFMVEIDTTLLSGALKNLILNALEHVCDLDDPKDREVLVQLTEEPKRAALTITNRGPEISPEHLATFFDKFNAHGKQGTIGLGTTYARQVVKAHGGTISVTSNSSDGTVVTVRLPM